MRAQTQQKCIAHSNKQQQEQDKKWLFFLLKFSKSLMKSHVVLRCVLFFVQENQTKENNMSSLVHTRKQKNDDDDDFIYRKNDEEKRKSNTKHTQNHLTPIKWYKGKCTIILASIGLAVCNMWYWLFGDVISLSFLFLRVSSSTFSRPETSAQYIL